MTPERHILDGCWQVYVAVSRPVIHPAILGALKRGGYVTATSPIELTAKGRAVIHSLEHAHIKAGVPLPDPNRVTKGETHV